MGDIIPGTKQELPMGSSLITRWPSLSHGQGMWAAQHRLKAMLDVRRGTAQHRPGTAQVRCDVDDGLLDAQRFPGQDHYVDAFKSSVYSF